MKNSNDFARRFAKLYGIEIIEAPDSHQFIKDNNDVVSFNDSSFWEAFCAPICDSLPYGYDNIPFIDVTTGFIAKRVDKICFKTNEQSPNDVIHPGDYQYAMAA
jgi:hypothetical protein